MPICRDLKITIKGDRAELSDKLYVYQHDKNIEIHFSIVDYKYRFDHCKENLLRSLTNAYARATVLKPNKKDKFKTPKAPIIDDKINFLITPEMTDELEEIGEYTLQFHLYDNGDSRGTIPPITFEVKPLIADVPDIVDEDLVGEGKVGSCRVTEDLVVMEIIDGRAYAKTNWQTGDLITAAKLNKIEDKLESLHETSRVFLDDSITFESTGFAPGITISNINDEYLVITNKSEGKLGYTIQTRTKLDISCKQEVRILDGSLWGSWKEGSSGQDGLDGITPTFSNTVDVTTGNAGTNASANVNEVSPNNYQISLTIPRGTDGLPGTDGADGVNGRELQIQVSSTHIQWRYAGQTSWTNLIALSSITGSNGTDGKSVELQKTATHIQWRSVGGSWVNIVAIEDITGVNGVDGFTWKPSVDSNGNLSWTKNSSTTTPPNQNIKGLPGKDANTLILKKIARIFPGVERIDFGQSVSLDKEVKVVDLCNGSTLVEGSNYSRDLTGVLVREYRDVTELEITVRGIV